MLSAKYLKTRSWRHTCELVNSARRSPCCVDASTAARRRETLSGSSAHRPAESEGPARFTGKGSQMMPNDSQYCHALVSALLGQRCPSVLGRVHAFSAPLAECRRNPQLLPDGA